MKSKKVNIRNANPITDTGFILKHGQKKTRLRKMIENGIVAGDEFYDLIAELIYEAISLEELYDIVTKAENRHSYEFEQGNAAKAFYIDALKKVIDVDRVIEKLHQIEIGDNAKSVSQFCNN